MLPYSTVAAYMLGQLIKGRINDWKLHHGMK